MTLKERIEKGDNIMSLLVEIKVNDILIERIIATNTGKYLGADEPNKQGMWEYLVNDTYPIEHYRPDGYRELARKMLKEIKKAR